MTRLSPGLLVAAVVAVTLCIFLPAVRYGYVILDDPVYVENNPFVMAGLTWESVKAAFRVFSDEYWVPVLFLSFMADVELFGPQSWGFHLVNILLHAANVALVFLLLRGATRRTWPAALASLIFAVHPLRVESVVWVSQRKDVLSTFLFLLAVAAWGRCIASSEGIRRAVWHALTSLALLLSLMTKPMLVTFPFLLLILDVWPLERLTCPDDELRNAWNRYRPLLLEKSPYLAIGACFAIATLYNQRDQIWVVLGWKPVLDAVLRMPLSSVVYLGKMVWPFGLGLEFRPPVASLPIARGVAAMVVHVAILWVLWRMRRTRPWLLAGWSWFLVALLPTSGIVPVGIQWVSDRFTYLPSLGIAVALAWTVDELGVRLGRHLTAAAAVTVVLVLCGVTLLQMPHWAKSTTLFRHSIKLDPGSARAWDMMGAALVSDGRLDEALEAMEQARRLAPDDPVVLSGLGKVLAEKGFWAEAVSMLGRVARIRPDSADAQLDLARALGKSGDEQGFLSTVDRLLALGGSAERRSITCVEISDLMDEMGRKDEAIDFLARAVHLTPDDSIKRFNLALALILQGRADEAAGHFSWLLQADEGDHQARMGLAESLALLGRTGDAIDEYNRVARLREGSADGFLAQGRIAQIQDRLADARALFTRGMEAASDSRTRSVIQSAMDSLMEDPDP